MIKNNLTTLTSMSANYKLDNSYSTLQKSKDISNGAIEKKDTVSISLKTEKFSYRDMKVKEIKEKIKAGEYKINNEFTSKAIIEELKILK